MIDYLSQLAALTFFLIIGGVLGWLIFPPRRERKQDPIVVLTDGKALVLRNDADIRRLVADARAAADCDDPENADLISRLCETVEQLAYQRDKYQGHVQVLTKQKDELLKEAAR